MASSLRQLQWLFWSGSQTIKPDDEEDMVKKLLRRKEQIEQRILVKKLDFEEVSDLEEGGVLKADEFPFLDLRAYGITARSVQYV